MASDSPPPQRNLTRVELVINCALFCGIGYVVGGAVGAWVGAGLVTILYAQSIWRSASAKAAGEKGDQMPDSKPPAKSSDGT